MRPCGVGVEVPAVHCLAALAESVDIDDGREVVEPAVPGLLERLPHRALGHLAVTAQHPNTEAQPGQTLAGQGHPDPDGQALTE
jgi:hypothetical protein